MLKLGNTGINKLYLGSTEIKKAYLGTMLVFDNTVIPLYGDVSAAYTLRKLFTWDNAVLTLRRSSDNAETSVFFDTNGKISLTSLVSAGGSLGTWIGANDAFIKEWFALTSDNIIDTNKTASQSTTSNQPQFISGGVIITKNGEPTIDFLNNNRYLQASANSDLNNGNDFTVLSVTANEVSNTNQVFFVTDTSNINIRLFNDRRIVKAVAQVTTGDGGFLLTYISQENTTSQKLITLTINSNLETAYYNGTSQDSDTYTGTYNNNILRIGSNQGGSGSINKIQEIIIFPSDKTSVLSDIDTDINNYYSIY